MEVFIESPEPLQVPGLLALPASCLAKQPTPATYLLEPLGRHAGYAGSGYSRSPAYPDWSPCVVLHYRLLGGNFTPRRED